MSENNDKPTSLYIKAEAQARYAESKKHLKRAELARDPLSAMAAQTQHSFGRVLDALATVCKLQEDILERLKLTEERNPQA